mmetsp:Transcript_73843/g.130452  ORF Transcript_73843/g.130452 Transcript_73843/m.130452 type:complete len:387 (+) Transcript_73843:39-1199(+)
MAKEVVKVVVRLLPPEITEDEFVATVPELHLQRTTWRSFQAGKRYKGEAKPSVNSRCYFLFDTEENADLFVRDYHGHQFVDGQGETFRAVVCFAPYAKVPKSKNSKDPRDGTIVDDAFFKEFLEKLEQKAEYEAPDNPVLSLKPSNPKDTPLLNYMKDRAVERRAKAAKRERERQKWREDRLGRIAEDKRSKWRCHECGTSKNLEEDPDRRGTFYCTYCWEHWEAKEVKKAKKKKKKGKAEDWEEWPEEEEEEEEEATSSKKKKKKKKKSAEWSEWYEWEEEGGEETKKKKKKSKKKAEEEWYWEESTTGKSSKKKGKKEEEQWWVDSSTKDESETSEKKKRSSRWKAKDSGAAEEEGEASEKPRRSRKKDESQWVPKTKSKSTDK